MDTWSNFPAMVAATGKQGMFLDLLEEVELKCPEVRDTDLPLSRGWIGGDSEPSNLDVLKCRAWKIFKDAEDNLVCLKKGYRALKEVECPLKDYLRARCVQELIEEENYEEARKWAQKIQTSERSVIRLIRVASTVLFQNKPFCREEVPTHLRDLHFLFKEFQKTFPGSPDAEDAPIFLKLTAGLTALLWMGKLFSGKSFYELVIKDPATPEELELYEKWKIVEETKESLSKEHLQKVLSREIWTEDQLRKLSDIDVLKMHFKSILQDATCGQGMPEKNYTILLVNVATSKFKGIAGDVEHDTGKELMLRAANATEVCIPAILAVGKYYAGLGDLNGERVVSWGSPSRESKNKAIGLFKKGAKAGNPLCMELYAQSLELFADASDPQKTSTGKWFRKAVKRGVELGDVGVNFLKKKDPDFYALNHLDRKK